MSSIGDSVTRAIEVRLLNGNWAPATRLPSERALAAEFGVSRNSLREAIQRLVARGLLVSRRGSGVFVTDRLHSGVASPWRQLLGEHPDLGGDMLEFRRVLEGEAAYLAALRATRADLARLREIIREMKQAHRAGDRDAETRLDARLHEVISEASHNSMFRHLHMSFLAMLREHIALNQSGLRDRDSDVSRQLLVQHDALWNAIRRGEAEQARQLMFDHIDFVAARLEFDVRGAAGRSGK